MAKKSGRKYHNKKKKEQKKIIFTEEEMLSPYEQEKILKKDWANITSMDLYHLYNGKYKTEHLSLHFHVKSIQIINRLRAYP